MTKMQLATIIRRMACNVHGKKSEVTVKRDRIDFTYCCEDFKKRIEKTIEDKRAKDFDDKLNDLFS